VPAGRHRLAFGSTVRLHRRTRRDNPTKCGSIGGRDKPDGSIGRVDVKTAGLVENPADELAALGLGLRPCSAAAAVQGQFGEVRKMPVSPNPIARRFGHCDAMPRGN
jgi:hypothetical protein